MRILLSPNSMKGSLDANTFAETLKKGLMRAGGNFECFIAPLADGGDGTGLVLARALGANAHYVKVSGPDLKPVSAPFYLSGTKAVIEMADASGMKLQGNKKSNPMETSSFGTGQLILEAVKAGARELVLGTGGSATVDGGTGCLEALGYRFLDKNGKSLHGCGKNLERIREIRPPASDPLEHCNLILACDVSNPLCGPQGAARVFAPQKGADDQMVKRLEAGLENWSKCLAEFTVLRWQDHPGCGSAGGIGAGLEALMGAKLEDGAGFVIKESGIDRYLHWADLVITGEGRLDSQSAFGKGPCVLAGMAKDLGKPVFAVVGSVEGLHPLFKQIISICKDEGELEYCMENAEKLIEEAAYLLGSELC